MHNVLTNALNHSSVLALFCFRLCNVGSFQVGDSLLLWNLGGVSAQIFSHRLSLARNSGESSFMAMEAPISRCLGFAGSNLQLKWEVLLTT